MTIKTKLIILAVTMAAGLAIHLGKGEKRTTQDVQEIQVNTVIKKKVTRLPNGTVIAETVVEQNSHTSIKTEPQPKPRYKITLFPIYSFDSHSISYGGLYERRASLPIIGDIYLGVFATTKRDIGLSLSKEFY